MQQLQLRGDLVIVLESVADELALIRAVRPHDDVVVGPACLVAPEDLQSEMRRGAFPT